MLHRLSSQKWSDLSAWVFPFFSTSIQNICLIAIFVCIIFLLHLCAFPLVSFYLHCIKSFDLRIISRPSISSIGVLWEHQPSSSPNPFIVTSIFFLKLVPSCTHPSVNHASPGGRALPALPTSLPFLYAYFCFFMLQNESITSGNRFLHFLSPPHTLSIIGSMLLCSTCPWAASAFLRRP